MARESQEGKLFNNPYNYLANWEIRYGGHTADIELICGGHTADIRLIYS